MNTHKLNTVNMSETVKVFEVFVSSIHNERPWKITIEAFGHTHAYEKANSIHNVTVLSTRQLVEETVYH